MIVYHVTSLASALSIMKSGKYIADKNFETSEDAWINLGIMGKILDLRGIFLGRKEVIMIFRWTGEIRRMVRTEDIEPDVLYDGMPTRALVRAGSSQFLNLIGIEIVHSAERFGEKFDNIKILGVRWEEPEISELFSKRPFYAITEKQRKRWAYSQEAKLKNTIIKIIEEKPKIVIRLADWAYARIMFGYFN